MKKALALLLVLVAVGGAAWWGLTRAGGPGLDAGVRAAAEHVPGNVAWVGILPPMGELDASLEAARVAVQAVVPDARTLEVMEADRREALGVDPGRRGVVGQLAGVDGRAIFAVVHRTSDAPALDDGLAAAWPHFEITECESVLGTCRLMGGAIRAILDGRVLYLLFDHEGAHEALVDGLASPLGDDEVFRQTMRFDTRPLVAGFVRPADWLAGPVDGLPDWARELAIDATESLADLEGMGMAVAREPDVLVAEVTVWSSDDARWLGVWDGRRSPGLVDELPGRADGFFHAQMDMDAVERSIRTLVNDLPESEAWLDEASEDAASYGMADPFAFFEIFTGEFAGVSLRSGESVFVAGLTDPDRVQAWLDDRTDGLTSPLRVVDVDGTAVYRTRILGVQMAAAVRGDRLWFTRMPVMRELLAGEREALIDGVSPAAAAAVRAGDPIVASLRPVRILDGLVRVLPLPAADMGEDIIRIVDDVVVTAGADGRFSHSRVDVHVDGDALDAWIGEQATP